MSTITPGLPVVAPRRPVQPAKPVQAQGAVGTVSGVMGGFGGAIGGAVVGAAVAGITTRNPVTVLLALIGGGVGGGLVSSLTMGALGDKIDGFFGGLISKLFKKGEEPKPAAK